MRRLRRAIAPAFELLAQVPAAHLTRTPPTTVERVYLLQHILGLQSLARGDVGGHALLVEALKGTNASEMVQGARDFAVFIASPHIELALFHRESDEDAHLKGIPAFDHSLRNALVLHRRYWRDLEPNPGERQQAHPWGFIALGPLAWATMRRDAGLPVRIASDYLPESLLRANRGGGQS